MLHYARKFGWSQNLAQRKSGGIMFNLMPYLALIAQQSSDDGGFIAAILSSFFTFCCVGIFVILAVAGM
jgi:hypothetical protein